MCFFFYIYENALEGQACTEWKLWRRIHSNDMTQDVRCSRRVQINAAVWSLQKIDCFKDRSKGAGWTCSSAPLTHRLMKAIQCAGQSTDVVLLWPKEGSTQRKEWRKQKVLFCGAVRPGNNHLNLLGDRSVRIGLFVFWLLGLRGSMVHGCNIKFSMLVYF